jgi:23S rRNA (uracil1939-C5)-methyltransferase
MTRIRIEKLAFGGAGLGEIEGKKVFVPFSAPGDVLEIEILTDKESFSEGVIVQVIEPASCRVMPECPVFGRCGGCQWQHLSYETQLEWKQIILKETLEHIGKFKNPNVLPTLPSPKQWNYRNRIQLHVDSKGHLGFYKAKSKEVIEFDRCFIADDKLNQVMNARREEFVQRRKGVGLRVHGGAHFSQVNVEQNENVKKILSEWLDEVDHEKVIELYAGSGNFTFPMSKLAKKITALEIDGRAVHFARQRAKKEQIENIEFHTLPAENLRQAFHKGTCDALFLNPPRKGAAEAIDVIMDVEPKTIFYMSCNPATLARDLSKFAENGWQITKCLPIDMFPQTFHIESLVQMVRKRS